MAKTKISDFVNEWMSKIKAGLNYRRKYSSYQRWPDFRKMYRHQWSPEIVPVNKIFSYARLLIPRIYFRAPRVTVTPLRPDLMPHAKVVEAIDNMLIREVLLKQTLKMSALDAFLCGIGPIKIGYDSEYGFIPELAVEEDGSTATQYSTTTGSNIEYNVGVKPGFPWALRVRPEDIIVPWGASDPSSLQWIAHYVVRPLKDVKEDQKYRNTDKLKGTRTPAVDKPQGARWARSSLVEDKSELYAELWEIRDARTQRMYVICEDQILLDVPDTLQIEGLPFEFVIFNPDPEFFWPVPDALILSSQQIELNETRTQASRHRAIALLKFLYKQGAITEEALQRFLSGEVGIAVPISSDDNINAVITALQPHVPPDLNMEAREIINDMRESLGVSPNQEGTFSPYHGKTATETMVVAESFEVRTDERRDVMADVLANIVRKWNQIIFSFWTEERVIQVTMPEGENVWVAYTGDQLRGEYFLHVEPDTGLPLTRGIRYQMALDLLKAFGGDPLIDQAMLRQIVLDNFAPFDPRVNRLLAVEPGTSVREVAAARQPAPIGLGPGRGSAGGRKGSTPSSPKEFEQFRTSFGMR